MICLATLKHEIKDFPCGPVVKNPYFHYRGQGSSHAARHGQKWAKHEIYEWLCKTGQH